MGHALALEKRARELEIYIPPGPRLGNVVIEAEGLRKGYGDAVVAAARSDSSGSAPGKPN